MSTMVEIIDDILAGERIPSEGLCVRLRLASDYDDLAFHDAISKWPMYSGNSGFPVPSANGEHPQVAYMSAEDLYAGEYGNSRLDLARHIKEFLIRSKEA